MIDKIQLHADICKGLTELYRAKNKDYGDSFGKSFNEYGMTMPCIRLEDKLNRLKSLVKNKEQMVADESIIDTIRDLANYSIMTLIEMNANVEEGWANVEPNSNQRAEWSEEDCRGVSYQK